MISSDDPRRSLAVQAAWLYHDRGLNQQTVAERLNVSRSTVSRLLADAQSQGIVRVIITEPLPETAVLAEELMDRYGLLSVTVAPTFAGESPMQAAALIMARRIENIAASGTVTIAAGWGRTLSMSANAVRPLPTSGVVIVDAFGHTTTQQTVSPVEVSATLAGRFGARVLHMPSPAFVASAEVARHFLESDAVADVVRQARSADVALVSVGVVGSESLLLTEGFMDPVVMDRLVARGAVGEVLGCYYDADGAPIDVPELHTVGLRFQDLLQIRRIVGVVAGLQKLDAVKGAIAAGILDEIAVDDALARALLA